eukprot:m.111700 g.111700  ORF g.111700 m.111700 type:complete len:99 (+) comp28140_c2_seq1:168-464(+)
MFRMWRSCFMFRLRLLLRRDAVGVDPDTQWHCFESVTSLHPTTSSRCNIRVVARQPRFATSLCCDGLCDTLIERLALSRIDPDLELVSFEVCLCDGSD